MESLPLNWDKYWTEINSATPIPPGRLNVSVELPFSFPFYAHPVSKITILPSGLISISSMHTRNYIMPMSTALDLYQDDSVSGLSYWVDVQNSSLTVEWKNAVVKELPSIVAFTLRVRIWSSGLI